MCGVKNVDFIYPFGKRRRFIDVKFTLSPKEKRPHRGICQEPTRSLGIPVGCGGEGKFDVNIPTLWVFSKSYLMPEFCRIFKFSFPKRRSESVVAYFQPKYRGLRNNLGYGLRKKIDRAGKDTLRHSTDFTERQKDRFFFSLCTKKLHCFVVPFGFRPMCVSVFCWIYSDGVRKKCFLQGPPGAMYILKSFPRWPGKCFLMLAWL